MLDLLIFAASGWVTGAQLTRTLDEPEWYNIVTLLLAIFVAIAVHFAIP